MRPPPPSVALTGAAIDHIHGEYYWVEWADGVAEIALDCSDARSKRVWRNCRKMESANVFRVIARAERP